MPATRSPSDICSFLDAWRSGDYPTSFDNLHRYFDYTMQNRDRLFYQYALMNLAVLQADFGCYDEAVAAMLETISTARENKDNPCLNFALNWMYHFGKAHPNIIKGTESTNMLGVEREGLAFLRIKAKETGMWTLWSSSLLSEAKLGMSNGESVASIFENILKSSHLIVDKNMKSMMGPQVAMYSALWQRLGVTQLSKQYCQVFLSCPLRRYLKIHRSSCLPALREGSLRRSHGKDGKLG
jgi:anaphase-promoting complex subunit 5